MSPGLSELGMSRVLSVANESCLIRIRDEPGVIIGVQDESCVIRAPQPPRMTRPCPVAQGEGRKPPRVEDKTQPQPPPSLGPELSSAEGGSAPAPAPRVQPLDVKPILFSLDLLNIEPSKPGQRPLTGASRTRNGIFECFLFSLFREGLKFRGGFRSVG